MLRNDSIYLAKSLHEAICSGHKTNADRLIRLMELEENSDENFSYLDSDNKSLLFLAIENGLQDIAQVLFEKVKTNQKVLFAKSSNGQTVFSITAAMGNSKLLIDLKDIKPENESDDELWMQADEDGNLPLHLACASLGSNKETIKVLLDLDWMQTEDNKSKHRTNNQGETPLHCALKIITPAMLDGALNVFLDHGANLRWRNNQGQAAYQFLYWHEYELLLNNSPLLFNKLSPDNQRAVLSCYVHSLNSHPDNDGLWKVYLQCTNQYKLKDYIAALYLYQLQRSGHNIYPFPTNAIEDDILKIRGIMDNYLGMKPALPSKLDTLDDDRVLLSDLYDAVANVENDLGQLPSVSNIRRKILGGLLGLEVAIFLGVEAWLLYETISYRPHIKWEFQPPRHYSFIYRTEEDCEKNFEYDFSDLDKYVYNLCDVPNQCWGTCEGIKISKGSWWDAFFPRLFTTTFHSFLIALFGTAGSIFVNSQWDKEPLVCPKREWPELAMQLKDNLVNKLQSLEEDARPIAKAQYDELEQAVNLLDNTMFKSEAINLMNRIKQLLRDTQLGLNQTQRSFSFFKPVDEQKETFIDIPNLDEEDEIYYDAEELSDNEIPLLNIKNFRI